MNAILLSLVLLGQVSRDDLLMVGPARIDRSELLMVGERIEAAAPVVRGVMLTASWCPPCRAFKANEVPRLVKGGWKVGEKETDHLQLIDAGNQAVTLPTFIRLVDGKEVARHVGSLSADQVAEFIYPKKAVAGDASAPTPGVEVERVIGLLPKPTVAFVDWGCGADARWCVAAVERWGCKAFGVEIDSARAAAARERVRSLGLSQFIEIIEGDATKVSIEADVGVAYLYGETLEQLRPRIEKLRAFASYRHQPPGVPVVKNGASWLYVKGQPVQQSRVSEWQGQYYSAPVCNDPSCAMCRKIRRDLNMPNPPKGSVWWSLF